MRWTAFSLVAISALAPCVAHALEVGEVPVDRPWFDCSSKSAAQRRYYPAHASNLGVDGRVMVQCKVSVKGVPESCVWLEETPAGYGFGDAASKLGCKVRFKAKDIEGVVPATLRFPLRFRTAN